jgi:MOSC domain-containing protein YiiM
MSGVLVAIFVSASAEAAMESIPRVRVLAGRGLAGDRYALREGTFSANAGVRDVTLIEAEALEMFGRDYGQPLDAGESRRNLLCRGVRLNDLVEKEFFVGTIPMRGMRLCEPCSHLARLTTRPVLPGLVHRGGLYAEILQDGELLVGDPIRISHA